MGVEKYHIEIQYELEQLLSLVTELHVVDSALWRVQVKGALNHWQDLKEQLEQNIEEDVIYIDLSDLDDDLDVYSYMDQEIVFKNLCVDLTYLIRLAYDLGVRRKYIIEIYQHILNLWFSYSDLIAYIQQQGQMQGTQPLILEVDYATALLLLSCAILFEGQHDVTRIVDGLLGYQSDRLLDILAYPYFDHPTISDTYHMSYPFQRLDQMFENGVDEHAIREYLSFVQKEQKEGVYFEKKRFHQLAVLGQWSFEVLALCMVYQLDVSQFQNFENLPIDF